MEDTAKNILGALHTAGKTVLGIFGAGGLADTVEEIEAGQDWLPDWALSPERRRRLEQQRAAAAKKAAASTSPPRAPAATEEYYRARWRQLDESTDPSEWRYYYRALMDLPLPGLDMDLAGLDAVGVVGAGFRERGEVVPDRDQMATWLDRRARARGLYKLAGGTDARVTPADLQRLRQSIPPLSGRLVPNSAQPARVVGVSRGGWYLIAGLAALVLLGGGDE